MRAFRRLQRLDESKFFSRLCKEEAELFLVSRTWHMLSAFPGAYHLRVDLAACA
jgi:hypothetical protein